MLSTIISSLITAGLSMVSKLATQTVLEAILTKVVIYGAEKLAPMTTNTLDDELVEIIKERLICTK